MDDAPLTDPARALAGIRAAAARLGPHVRRTPTVDSYTFSESAGCEVFLKLENLQRTGSFKLRGALNKLLTLPRAELERGLIAASAGNHAQGVALAARIVGAQATIVMPVESPLVKVQRTEAYGAEVVLAGDGWDASQARALALARERDLTFVHAFDDDAIVLGQGTVGIEVVEDVPELDAVVVPIGGGGLIAGIALAVRALAPRVRIVGVQASGASAMVRSVRAGRRITGGAAETIADGIRLATVAERTFEVIRRHVDELVTVEENEIVDAVLQTTEKSKVVAEPAGVVAIAAVASGKVRGAKRVCAVVSGGNVDPNQLARLIESALALQGRYHAVRLRLRDVPGQLSRVLSVLGELDTNVLEVEHHRAGWKVPVGFVDVEVLVETRRAGQSAQIDAALAARGFEVR